MENKMQVFSNEEFGEIRTVVIDGKIYFVGKDVALALGYKDTVNALKLHVADEDKMGWQITTPSRGLQTMTLINESGMYALIFGSKLERAKEFKHWVTSVVLPSIREKGYYAAGAMVPAVTAAMLREIANALDAKDAKITALEERVDLQQTKIAELEPKARYCEAVLDSKDTVTVGVIANDFGMSARKFNKLLAKWGIQHRQGNLWIPYQRYVAENWARFKTYSYVDSEGECRTTMHLQWTQVGRRGIYEEAARHGMFPQRNRKVIQDVLF